MPNGIIRGNVRQPSYADVLRDHRKRIAILEAIRTNLDSGWTDIGVFLNGWVSGANGEDIPGYVITSNSWLGLRGRVTGGSDGLPAFQLPTGAYPVNSHTFSADLSTGTSAMGVAGAGGNTGAVTIDSSGNVIPFGQPPGWVAVPFELLYNFGGDVALESIPWWNNSVGNTYEILNGGAFAIKGASLSAAKGAQYWGGERHTDGEIRATVSGATTVYLGLRTQLPYTTGAVSFPAGYWLSVPAAAGGAVTMNIVDFHGIATNYAGVITSPGFVSTDVITFRINYGTVQALKNGVSFLHVTPGSDQSHPWSSGYFGVGAQGTPGVSLITDLIGRLPSNVGVSLANCWVKL